MQAMCYYQKVNMNTTNFRIGIVGAGLIARDHALSLSLLPGVSELIFFDAQAERATQLAQEFDGSTASSANELAHNCDIVWICTPPFARRDAIAAATGAGKPIFCEKPLALNVEELNFVRQNLGASDAPFFMGQSSRYLAASQKIKALADGGAIGKLTEIWSSRLGWLDPAVTPPWRLEDERGGGVVIELGIHEIDFVNWIGGAWHSLYARVASQIVAPGKFQEAAFVLGTLENGATARLNLSWASPRYLWQRGVEGTSGSLFFDDSDVRRVELHRPEKDVEIFTVEDWKDEATGENISLREQAKEVLETLKNGAAPLVSLREGEAALQVALAIQESARLNKIVALEKLS